MTMVMVMTSTVTPITVALAAEPAAAPAAGPASAPASAPAAGTSAPTATPGRTPAGHVCPGSAIRVVGATPADRADICAGAADARRFLQAQGLTVAPAYTVSVGDRLPDEVSRTAAGCYFEDRQQAHLLSYAAFQRRRTWFGVRVSRALYRALAAHESAHAVAGCNFTIRRPAIQAREYIAYVAMFATMPEALRAQVLRAQPGTGFADENAINAITYLFEPMLFGAEAYRHFMSLGDGAAFLKDIVAGKVLVE
ncbi:MAG TPA: hypothetical protein PK072_08475 [Quisquiliibacterium sp.]|nr:hypothetical protein [Quisquiliibacterium sp.]